MGENGCPHGFIPWQECSSCLQVWYENHRDDTTALATVTHERDEMKPVYEAAMRYYKLLVGGGSSSLTTANLEFHAACRTALTAKEQPSLEAPPMRVEGLPDK